MAVIRRGGRDLRLTLLVICAVTAVFGAVVSRAAAAQYTVVDLGSQATDGTADSISASGLTVGMNCATWNNGVLTPSSGQCPLLGGVNSTNESVGPWPQPSSTDTPVQAISETPTGAPQDDFLTGPLQNEHPLVNPTQSATAIDDAGEIGGGVMSQPGGAMGLIPYGYIFDPAAPGHEVTLLPDAYDVYALTPDWAEVETNTPLALNPQASDMGLLDRANGTTTLTHLEAPAERFSSVGPNQFGSSLASDGTLVGLALSPCTPPSSTECVIYGTVTYTPTMRLPDGSEVTLDIPTGYVGTSSEAEAVNAHHYSVGGVHPTSEVNTEAAEWSPTGQFELLNDLIPSASGWDLQNAVAIADDGNIVGTGTLNGVEENFLLTNNSLLPTATTGVCVPAAVAPGRTTSCTFTVADTTPGSTQRPTGTVIVSSDQPGAITPASQCTLAATSTASKAACAVSYTPTQNGTPTLTGIYSGDGEHGSSHGTATVKVGTGGSGPGGPKAKVTKPKTSGTSAGASVSCSGSAGSSCTVTLTLSVTQTLSGNKVIAVSASKHKPKKIKRTVVLGSTTVKIAAGKTKTVSVSLNATGKRLLASRHSLSVLLTASQKGGAKHTFTVKFTAKKKKKKRK